MSERRRYPRIPYSGVVFISWKTFDGQRNHVLGRAVDVCERGIGIELATRIPVGSFVRVKAYGLNLDGSGTIRRVSRRAGGYVLGLELGESLDLNLLAELSASQAHSIPAGVEVTVSLTVEQKAAALTGIEPASRRPRQSDPVVSGRFQTNPAC